MSANSAIGAAERASSMRCAVVGLLSLGMVIAYIDRVNLTAAMPMIGTAADDPVALYLSDNRVLFGYRA